MAIGAPQRKHNTDNPQKPQGYSACCNQHMVRPQRQHQRHPPAGTTETCSVCSRNMCWLLVCRHVLLIDLWYQLIMASTTFETSCGWRRSSRQHHPTNVFLHCGSTQRAALLPPLCRCIAAIVAAAAAMWGCCHARSTQSQVPAGEQHNTETTAAAAAAAAAAVW